MVSISTEIAFGVGNTKTAPQSRVIAQRVGRWRVRGWLPWEGGDILEGLSRHLEREGKHVSL